MVPGELFLKKIAGLSAVISTVEKMIGEMVLQSHATNNGFDDSTFFAPAKVHSQLFVNLWKL